MLSATEAYPKCPDYDKRAARTFALKTLVHVGPAYRSNDTYEPDGIEGYYWILRADGSDYRLALAIPGEPCPSASEWTVWVYASRLQPAARCCVCGDPTVEESRVCSPDCERFLLERPDDDGWGESGGIIDERD